MKPIKALKALVEYVDQSGKDHYNADKLETMEILSAQEWEEGFCKGNIVKYICRHQFTQNPKDLLKAAHYILIYYESLLDKEK